MRRCARASRVAPTSSAATRIRFTRLLPAHLLLQLFQPARRLGVTIDPHPLAREGVDLIADARGLFIAQRIIERLAGEKIDYVGGVAVGAIPLVATVTMLSAETGHPLPGFFVRKEVKDHGTKKLVDGLGHGESLAGKRVAILEDVTTTGGSSMIAVAFGMGLLLAFSRRRPEPRPVRRRVEAGEPVSASLA